jgi:hypothetical protein
MWLQPANPCTGAAQTHGSLHPTTMYPRCWSWVAGNNVCPSGFGLVLVWLILSISLFLPFEMGCSLYVCHTAICWKYVTRLSYFTELTGRSLPWLSMQMLDLDFWAMLVILWLCKWTNECCIMRWTWAFGGQW